MANASGSARRPNVLYIHSHDTGRYVQPYGHAIPTPNIQRLAEQGVLFRQNFCAGPTCSPSRAALLTGQYPHSCGQLGLAHRGFELQHPERHLAWTLRNAGYHTALMGMQHVVRNERLAATGYEHIDAEKRHAVDVAAKTVAYLRTYATSPQDRPFFVDAGTTETHRVFHDADPAASPAEVSRYCLPPPVVPDTPETRQDMANFKASCRIWDAAIGEILAALDETGLADETLVVLTTDHGIAFPQMKCNLTDHGIGVLLLMRGPATVNGLRGGLVIDQQVSHVDVFPTICEVAGITPPAWLQGTSLLPLVRGEVEQAREEVFAEVNYHVPYEPQRCVRTTRWKYIRRFPPLDEYRRPLLANCDDGLSKDVWLRYGWSDLDTEPEQLYDLVFDPQERRNIAGDPRYADALDEIRGRLDRWMRQTEDPLLDGPIPLPEGAVVSPPELVSPRASR